jgi:Sulfotransferase family
MAQSAAQALDMMRDLANARSANSGQIPGQGCEDPVFVLCLARSGSTLMRFLLDAHHDLACPPETNLAALCSDLTGTWSVLAGVPALKNRDGVAPTPTEPVLAGVRHTVNQMIAEHLARRGKRRYCDKSMHTARHADLLLQLFPGAKFICLYRHPMDVIASGIDACPWGLKGFGFDSYAAGSPNNAVLALARFWADDTAAILAVEERYPDRCHRVRYEDLVSDAEAVADGIFGFLGVPSQPGISGACFAPERERHGRGDYKIWQTSGITADSVGKGWSIPPNLIEPGVTATINELADKLRYIRVDEKWSVADTPPDLRLPTAVIQPAGVPREPADVTRQMPRVYLMLAERLQAGLFRASDRFARCWGARAGESFMVIATSPPGGEGPARWLVDLAARTVTLAEGSATDVGADRNVTWQITGSAVTWERVLNGSVNLNVALRRHDLRYCDTGAADATVPAARIGMLADLCAITSWRSAQSAQAPAA